MAGRFHGVDPRTVERLLVLGQAASVAGLRIGRTNFFLIMVAARLCAGVTFDDAAPILRARCQSCHSPGEVAPMPLRTYEEARPWAKAIRESVRLRRMPPWHADPAASHEFEDERRLSEREIATLAAWAEEGAKPGAASGKTTSPVPPRAWKLGEPDFVARIPEYKVAPSGAMAYTFLIVPTGFARDTWIRAVEFRIDQRAVVHHINVYARAPQSSYLRSYPKGELFVPTKTDRPAPLDRESIFDAQQFLAGYEPGYVPSPWGLGRGKLIKAGSDIIVQVHYTANGKETIDSSEAALYAAATPPAERMISLEVKNSALRIPPGDPYYLSEASVEVARPLKIVSLQPHMHLRGKAMDIRVRYPGGGTDSLLSVPRYDFNWQTIYRLRDPVTLPAGAKIETVAHFDNSANNPHNPDPSKTVGWGEQTWDEMHIGFIELAVPADTDPDTLIVGLRKHRKEQP